MLDEGLPKEKILNDLENRLDKDMEYESGKILGSMCTSPHHFALQVFSKYAHKNLGDPGLFPGTLDLERELISDIGNLLGGSKITGSIVSGGSEANIMAVRIAKKMSEKIEKPEVVCSANAHMSFYKAADLMGIKIRAAKLDEHYLPDMDHYRSLVNENTIGLIGIAGTTSLGLVEPIEEMAAIAEERNLFLHVDAAFGGFSLPYMEKLGHSYKLYDFRVDKVDSITADPHKMGMGVIPGGGLLIREDSLIEKYGFSIPYLAGGGFKHLTVTGTRSGASAISFWALMQYLGNSGFKMIMKRCWDNTQYLVKRIDEIEGIEIAAPPKINIIGIKPSIKLKNSICQVDDALRELGWALGVFKKLNIARIVCMPHIKHEHAEALADDLESVTRKILK